jgi:type IX secretion system PorP/SprF family membrane protein
MIMKQEQRTEQRNRRTTVLAVALTVCLGNVQAQQHPSLDNYLFTPVAVSPAHAGMQDQHVVSLVDAQWVGVKGAPRTGMISMDYRDLRGLGLNLTLINDQVGPAITQHAALSGAYHLPVSNVAKLSTGLRLTVGRTSVDLMDETYYDQVDPNIYNLQGPFMANIDFGTTFNTPTYYAGVSFKNVNRAKIYDNNYTAQVLQFFGGYRMPIQGAWSLRTSFLASAATNAPADLNFHAFMEHSEKWGMGLHYSPADEVGALLRLNPSNEWHVFYQYNFPLTDLVYLTQRSHVIGISFNVTPRIASFTSPRLFL